MQLVDKIKAQYIRERELTLRFYPPPSQITNTFDAHAFLRLCRSARLPVATKEDVPKLLSPACRRINLQLELDANNYNIMLVPEKHIIFPTPTTQNRQILFFMLKLKTALANFCQTVCNKTVQIKLFRLKPVGKNWKSAYRTI